MADDEHAHAALRQNIAPEALRHEHVNDTIHHLIHVLHKRHSSTPRLN
jgi:hypothetical protein